MEWNSPGSNASELLDCGFTKGILSLTESAPKHVAHLRFTLPSSLCTLYAERRPLRQSEVLKANLIKEDRSARIREAATVDRKRSREPRFIVHSHREATCDESWNTALPLSQGQDG